MTLFTFLMAAVLTAPEVRVETLDEGVREGRIVEWQEEGLLLEQEGEDQRLHVDWEQVLRIDHTEGTTNTVPSASGGIEVHLVDGTQVVARDYRIAKDRLTLLGALDKGVDSELEVPLSAVHWLRTVVPASEGEELAARLQAHFDDILQLRPVGDFVVIRKPGGDALNYVEGVIGDVNQSKVEFILDEQTIEVNREKVFGLVYYRQRSNDEPAPSIVVVGPGGRLTAQSVEWQEDHYLVNSEWLGAVRLPADQVQTIDYSAGRMTYLSDLEPRRIDWTPPSAMPMVNPLFGGVVRDRGFYATRLTLEYPPESLDPSVATSAGVSRQVDFRKGLALRSRTDIVYRLPAGFKQFRATAGIDPKTRATGTVVLTILGDGRELIRESIVGKEAPHEIVCSVEDVRELQFIVDSGSQSPLLLGTGANLHLGNARLTK